MSSLALDAPPKELGSPPVSPVVALVPAEVVDGTVVDAPLVEAEVVLLPVEGATGVMGFAEVDALPPVVSVELTEPVVVVVSPLRPLGVEDFASSLLQPPAKITQVSVATKFCTRACMTRRVVVPRWAARRIGAVAVLRVAQRNPVANFRTPLSEAGAGCDVSFGIAAFVGKIPGERALPFPNGGRR